MTGPTISKSKFLNALQCPLLLWTQFNDRDAIPLPDVAQQHIFDTGHRVGDLAKELYPDGVEVDFDPTGRRGGPTVADTVAETQKLLAERRPIFEASFLLEDGPGARYLRADVMIPAPDGAWDLIEVKSGTRVKDVNVWDVAYQADTLDRAGVLLRRLCLMHVNNQYVRSGNIAPAELFAFADITAEARARIPQIPVIFTDAVATIAGDRPRQPIGPHCTEPHTCPLIPVCWRDVPPHHVTELAGAAKKAFTLVDQGHTLITDTPDALLTPRQVIQKQAIVAGRPHVEPGAARRFLDRLQYPLWHLDFESYNPAVPLFDGTRPYQQIPFQFSLHVQDAPGAPPRHVEFLWAEASDPRPALIDALQAIGPEGTVLAFNMTFERGVLGALGEAFPAHRAMTSDLAGRLADLADPFRSWSIYHPDQRGRYSLKAVLPAFTGRGYDDLVIADGQAAGREWVRVVHGDPAPAAADRDATLAALRAYCERDTYAMVELLEVLATLAQSG
jgi:hypothetical protein